MKSWRGCYFQSLDEAALDTSSAVQESGATHLDDKNQPSGTCIFGTENSKPENNNLIDEMLLLKESGCSFHNPDYVEMIKEFQSYVDMVFGAVASSTELPIHLNELVAHSPLRFLWVPAEALENVARFQALCQKPVKRFTRPGCSAEALDVALSSLSSLVNTLFAMSSSKRHIIHASL